MTEAEIGVIRGDVGFDYAIWGDTYSLGRSDFRGFDSLGAIPNLVVFNREG